MVGRSAENDPAFDAKAKERIQLTSPSIKKVNEKKKPGKNSKTDPSK